MGKVTSIRTPRRLTANARAGTPIEKLLAEARLKLIETGSRNRLIHTPRGAKRSRALTITGNASDQVFANLVREKKPLRLLAAGEFADIQRDAATPETRTDDPNGLQTSLSPVLLDRRLHAMHRGAKTAEEECGVNILFLALGFLRWYEDESDVPRDAPLILLQVYLGREARRSTFDLKLREDEIATNRALQERLRGDFGLALPDVAETEGWQPSSYFDAVANAVAAKRRWSIDANAIELGFYSFAKLLMMRDLEPGNWPDNALVSHPLLRGLLGEGFAAEPPVPPEAVRLDEILDPADLIHVVDAESSQARVIETVRAGRNLVVQGPPGTGKSQTITNIIAAAVRDGQTVLFVAEKMAALNVVYDRLDKVGLGDIFLELHSRAANKRLVAERLDRTLQAAAEASATDETTRQLTAARDRLNDAAKRLHAEIGDTGILASLLADVWQEKRTVFRLIHEVARTVGELAAFDPHLNAERVIGIARDVTAEAHGDYLETGLNEVVNAFADRIKFLDIDIAAIFQTESIGTIDLNRLSEWAASWAASHVRFEEWARLVKADRKVRAAGLAWFASALASGELDPKNAYVELETAFAEACWKKAIAADPELAAFAGDRHGELVAQFIEIEERSREAAVASVRARHQAAIPRGALGEMRVIRGEIGRKRAHMPLRMLMKAAGGTIQKIKPVFLMSPVSVAQFLPPGSVDFDLLVIDEANQLRPEDALGLVARCRRIVVVGDKKQLPPATFFDRMIAGEAIPHGKSAPMTDLESILSLCEARGLECQTLRWPYPVAAVPDRGLGGSVPEGGEFA